MPQSSSKVLIPPFYSAIDGRTGRCHGLENHLHERSRPTKKFPSKIYLATHRLDTPEAVLPCALRPANCSSNCDRGTLKAPTVLLTSMEQPRTVIVVDKRIQLPPLEVDRKNLFCKSNSRSRVSRGTEGKVNEIISIRSIIDFVHLPDSTADLCETSLDHLMSAKGAQSATATPMKGQVYDI